MFDIDITSRVMARVASTNNGIWSRSSAAQYFIYCVGQNPIQTNAFMCWAYNNDVSIKPLLGQYKGQSERSFISRMDQFDLIQPWLRREESYLCLRSMRGADDPLATLHYLSTDTTEELGYLRQVPRHVAFKCDSWTLDPLTGCYYAVVE